MLRLIAKIPRAVRFVLYVVWEVILSNLNVARIVLLTPNRALRPGIIAVPLDVTSDAEITTLANLITLTPGTLSLDVSSDRRTLYVHALEAGDPETFRRGIKAGFERAVMEVYR